MKYLNITALVLILLITVASIVLSILSLLPVQYLIIGLIVMCGIGLSVIILGQMMPTQKDDVETEPQTVIDDITNESEQEPTDKKDDADVVTKAEKNLWSEAMYRKYSSRWNDLLENISYPVKDSEKADIALLSWEIASLTMDYLMVDNDDPNVLERNKESVDAVITDKKITELNLKEFYEDPTTVPKKVLAIHDTLKGLITDNQSCSTQIFGYLVNISKSNE